MEYRKRKGSDRWHWCQNCSDWPAISYERKFTKPTVGGLCNECKTIEQHKNLKTN